MTEHRLQQIQTQLGMTNERLAETLGINGRTLSYWKAGRVAVPGPAALALTMLAHYRDDLELWAAA